MSSDATIDDLIAGLDKMKIISGEQAKKIKEVERVAGGITPQTKKRRESFIKSLKDQDAVERKLRTIKRQTIPKEARENIKRKAPMGEIRKATNTLKLMVFFGLIAPSMIVSGVDLFNYVMGYTLRKPAELEEVVVDTPDEDKDEDKDGRERERDDGERIRDGGPPDDDEPDDGDDDDDDGRDPEDPEDPDDEPEDEPEDEPRGGRGRDIIMKILKSLLAAKGLKLTGNEFWLRFKRYLSGGDPFKSSADVEKFLDLIKDYKPSKKEAQTLARIALKGLTSEIHPPGYQYLGPGTNFGKRITGSFRESLPASMLDALAMKHDMFYMSQDPLARQKADLTMIKDIFDVYIGDIVNTQFPDLGTAGVGLGAMVLFSIKYMLESNGVNLTKLSKKYLGKEFDLTGDERFKGTFSIQDQENLIDQYHRYLTIMDDAGYSLTGNDRILRSTARSDKEGLNKRTKEEYAKFRAGIEPILRKSEDQRDIMEGRTKDQKVEFNFDIPKMEDLEKVRAQSLKDPQVARMLIKDENVNNLKNALDAMGVKIPETFDITTKTKKPKYLKNLFKREHEEWLKRGGTKKEQPPTPVAPPTRQPVPEGLPPTPQPRPEGLPPTPVAPPTRQPAQQGLPPTPVPPPTPVSMKTGKKKDGLNIEGMSAKNKKIYNGGWKAVEAGMEIRPLPKDLINLNKKNLMIDDPANEPLESEEVEAAKQEVRIAKLQLRLGQYQNKQSQEKLIKRMEKMLKREREDAEETEIETEVEETEVEETEVEEPEVEPEIKTPEKEVKTPEKEKKKKKKKSKIKVVKKPTEDVSDLKGAAFNKWLKSRLDDADMQDPENVKALLNNNPDIWDKVRKSQSTTIKDKLIDKLGVRGTTEGQRAKQSSRTLKERSRIYNDIIIKTITGRQEELEPPSFEEATKQEQIQRDIQNDKVVLGWLKGKTPEQILTNRGALNRLLNSKDQRLKIRGLQILGDDALRQQVQDVMDDEKMDDDDKLNFYDAVIRDRVDELQKQLRKKRKPVRPPDPQISERLIDPDDPIKPKIEKTEEDKEEEEGGELEEVEEEEEEEEVEKGGAGGAGDGGDGGDEKKGVDALTASINQLIKVISVDSSSIKDRKPDTLYDIDEVADKYTASGLDFVTNSDSKEAIKTLNRSKEDEKESERVFALANVVLNSMWRGSQSSFNQDALVRQMIEFNGNLYNGNGDYKPRKKPVRDIGSRVYSRDIFNNSRQYQSKFQTARIPFQNTVDFDQKQTAQGRWRDPLRSGFERYNPPNGIRGRPPTRSGGRGRGRRRR